MEAAGLSIGIAALFTTCVQCFEYFKAATTLQADFEILLLKLEIEQERFLVWGEDTGIGNSDWDENSLFNGDPKRQDLVRRCLDAIRGLLDNAEDLKSKYGVQPTSPVTRSTDHRSISSNALKRLRLRFGRSQDKPTILRKTKWVIHDAAKFGKLIEHLRDLINGLKKDGHGPRDTLQEKVQTDIAYMIDDIRQLRLLSEACEDAYPEWSDTARSAIDASELGTEGGYLKNDPLAQLRGTNVMDFDDLPTHFGDEKVFLNPNLQIFFILTAQCRNQETELPCEQTGLGRMSFDATKSFIRAMTQNTRSHPGQWIGKLIYPSIFTHMDFGRYEEYLMSISMREINEGLDTAPSTGRFSVQVYLYCAPCSCQVASALQVAWSLGQFPYLDVCVRVDYRLQSSCSIASSGINGIQSIISYIKELENLASLGISQEERLKFIDRQWLEQAVYNYEDETETMSKSPADQVSQIVKDHTHEQTCAALVILGEADYCIPLVGAPPFPPLSLGKVPQETELYQMSQQWGQAAVKRHWTRRYMGTYTAMPPPVKKRRLPMTSDTGDGSQQSLPPAKRSATSELSQIDSQD
ncbi:MAG: hypothetical protein L6R38_005235 [Xanthoria sp. 2 TBL-2021]|nr:MAG: hypothetical protein L6R38_005235 [Xanthoria sp. 2 TBL-2021]